jgi:hypothetical protein
MDQRAFFDAVVGATSVEEVRAALREVQKNPEVKEIPFGGRPNNCGAIEVAADAARSAIERVTNAHDAVLEIEHEKQGSKPDCRSPREAAHDWLGVPMKDGLSGLIPKERQNLALNAIARLEPGVSHFWGQPTFADLSQKLFILYL